MKNTAPAERLNDQGHEVMATAFAIHDSDATKSTFGGLASVFNNLIDTWMPTRIKPGAFNRTLAENAKRVKVLYQHDSYMPIGLPTKMEETPDGLLVEAKVSATTWGKDCMILLADKVIDEMSIGFDPIAFTMMEENLGGMKTMVRHITELRLWEFSPVTWGANSQAKITNVNSMYRAVQALGFGQETNAYLMHVLEALKTCPDAEPADLCKMAAQRLGEQHEGKVLSAKHLSLVRDCRDTLNQLIDAAEPPAKKDEEALTDITEAMRELDILDLELMSKR